MATISTLAINLIARTRVFEHNMRRSQRTLTQFKGTALAATASLAKMAVVAGAGLAMRGAIREYASFEKNLAMVNTMLDRQTSHYLPQYAKQLRRMAMEYGESTGALSKGLYDILSASIAPARAMGVLDVAVKAAKAGMTDTAVAADALTTILNAYNLSADKAEYASDILFATIKRGKTTMELLAPNIGKVASLASVAGVSLEELGATIATLTRAMGNTDLAITGLRGILRAFLKPADEAKEVAKEYGIALNTATLQAIGLSGVLEKLRRIAPEQLARLVPRMQGLAAFAAGLQQISQNAEDVAATMDAAGKTQEAYNKMTGTTAHKIDQLKATFKDVGISLGRVVRPFVQLLNLGVTPLAAGADKLGSQLDRLNAVADEASSKTPAQLRNWRTLFFGGSWREMPADAAKTAQLYESARAKALEAITVHGDLIKQIDELEERLRLRKMAIPAGLAEVRILAERGAIPEATRRLSQIEAAVREAISSYDDMSNSVYRVNDAIDQLKNRLYELQTAMPQRAIKLRALDAIGATQGQLEEAARILKQIDAAKMVDTIEQRLTEAQGRRGDIGLSAYEQQKREVDNILEALLKIEGLPAMYFERALKLAKELQRTLRQIERREGLQQEQEQLEAFRDQVLRSIETPMDKYKDFVRGILELYDKGLIKAKEAVKAFRQRRQELFGAAPIMQLQDIGTAKILRPEEMRSEYFALNRQIPDLKGPLDVANRWLEQIARNTAPYAKETLPVNALVKQMQDAYGNIGDMPELQIPALPDLRVGELPELETPDMTFEQQRFGGDAVPLGIKLDKVVTGIEHLNRTFERIADKAEMR
jgi:TP901 family phage tail tape measure protein